MKPGLAVPPTGVGGRNGPSVTIDVWGYQPHEGPTAVPSVADRVECHAPAAAPQDREHSAMSAV